MTDTLTALPVRSCYGCGNSDNHPRFTHIVDMHDATKDQTYHYDCIPAGVADHHGLGDSAHPAHKIRAAAVRGVHGDELRDLAVKHAKSLQEEAAYPGQES